MRPTGELNQSITASVHGSIATEQEVKTMLSANGANPTLSAARGRLAGDILWLAVIAGVFATIVLN
jgi:hypothetical protein